METETDRAQCIKKAVKLLRPEDELDRSLIEHWVSMADSWISIAALVD